jgi:hypothetical protein
MLLLPYSRLVGRYIKGNALVMSGLVALSRQSVLAIDESSFNVGLGFVLQSFGPACGSAFGL